MNNLKKVLLLGLCASVVFAFTACGEPYSGVKFSDYIKVGKYKGLEVQSYSTKVTDKEVNQKIKDNRDAAAKSEFKEKGTVKKGDTVRIDFVGKINGKKFEGGTGEDQSLTIGSNQFIDGFESGLIGVKVGDSKTLHLKFPQDYNNSDVAGKDVTFDVKVKSKQVRTVPELDEDFVKSQMKDKKEKKDVKTVADYKKYIKKELEKQKDKEGKAEQKSYLWNQVVSTSEIKKDKDGKEKYPDEQVDEQVERITQQYKDYAKQNKMELKDFLKQQMGMDEKTFKQQVKAYAQSMVKEDLIVYYIADKEGIEVSDDEYDKYIEDTLAEYGYTPEQYEEQTGKSYEEANGEDNIKTQVYKDKVQDLILDNAKVKGKNNTKKKSKNK